MRPCAVWVPVLGAGVPWCPCAVSGASLRRCRVARTLVRITRILLTRFRVRACDRLRGAGVPVVRFRVPVWVRACDRLPCRDTPRTVGACRRVP